ncbi:MAG: FAD-dependent oxidoreductase, partial [Verrucomicrobia bacterium]|nr:FAD-dependent oxidoreductase [Cytophagales bacterium]
MKKLIDLILSPEIAFDEPVFEDYICKMLGTSKENTVIRPVRRSIDARSRQIKVNVVADVFMGEMPPPLLHYDQHTLPDVSKSPQAIVVGAGPGGIFAALRLIELGIKPILIERGKDVRARRRDIAALTDHIVNPESNYCFGEGGAGTYSDGKLYTRSKKRGDLRRILEILVAHEAQADILADAHPHIGTNKLPKIVANLRQTIIDCGGIVLFETKVTDLLLKNDEIKGIITEKGEQIEGIGVILATGHSARDIFELLHHRNVFLEAKPFAMGVRVEHQQAFIDELQYKISPRGNFLPAAAYSWVEQVVHEQVSRGIFSFCMCPGGYIVPAATAPGEVVVNGMSPSRRDSKFANSGIVMSVEAEEWQVYEKKYGVLAGLQLQKYLEQQGCTFAGGKQTAPAQLMVDFVNKK